MTLAELCTMPTILDYEHITGRDRVHESVFRSYQVLQKAREWLLLGTNPQIVLEMIELAMSSPGKEKCYEEI